MTMNLGATNCNKRMYFKFFEFLSLINLQQLIHARYMSQSIVVTKKMFKKVNESDKWELILFP